MEERDVPSGGKSPLDSMVEMTELVLPNDTNLLGNLLGGRLMHWIDIAGAMAAQRHSNRIVATVSVDNIEFRHPIRMGEVVVLKARLTWVGKTSMEILVKSYAENFLSGNRILANQANITYVALGDDNKPVPVPPLILATEEDKELYRIAGERRRQRIGKNS